MDGSDCRRCGARNAPDADFCWQCYGPFGASRRPSAAVGYAEPGFAAPASPRRAAGPAASLKPFLRAGALVAVAAGGWLAWLAFTGGFEFPRSVGGFERIETETAEQVQAVLDAVGGLADAEMEAAFYGAGAEPVYAVMAIDPPEAVPEADVLAALEGAGAPFPVQPGPGGGACLPYADLGSACMWAAGGRYVVAVQGYGVAVEQLQPVAEEVWAETG